MTVVQRRRRAYGERPERKASPSIGSCTVVGDGVAIVVLGRPAPQGSKAPGGREDNPRTRPWRDSIKAVCDQHLPPGWDALDGPLEVDAWFYFEPPASAAPGSLPSTKTTYDVDKLMRAMGDGLTDGRVIVDDARVADLHVHKRYTWDGNEPRAVVTVAPARDSPRP